MSLTRRIGPAFLEVPQPFCERPLMPFPVFRKAVGQIVYKLPIYPKLKPFCWDETKRRYISGNNLFLTFSVRKWQQI